MKIQQTGIILAVVTMDKDAVSGGVPIFFAKNEEEKQKTALFLSKVLDGMVHDLENGIVLITKH